MDKYAAQKRYAKKNITQIKINCVHTTDADILEKLDGETNKAGYIKNLIRADIAASKKPETPEA